MAAIPLTGERAYDRLETRSSLQAQCPVTQKLRDGTSFTPESRTGRSGADRGLLRKSVRDLMAVRWPADKAVEMAGSPEAITLIWRDMARQGLAALGSDKAEVGLRETVL